jgi:hypothetical protein
MSAWATGVWNTDAWYGTAWFFSGTPPAPVVPTKVGGDDVPRTRKHKGFDLEEWKRERKSFDESLEKTIKDTWAALNGESQQEAQSIVSEYVETGKPLPVGAKPEFRVDWERALRDEWVIFQIAQMETKYRQQRIAMQREAEERLILQRRMDDEAVTLLLLS